MHNLTSKNGNHQKYEIVYLGEKHSVPSFYKALSNNYDLNLSKTPFQKQFKSFAAVQRITTFDFDNKLVLEKLLNFNYPTCDIDNDSIANSIRLINNHLIDIFGIYHLRVSTIELNSNGKVVKSSKCFIECDNCGFSDRASIPYSRTIADIERFGFVCKGCNGQLSLSAIDLRRNIEKEINERGVLLRLSTIDSNKPLSNSNCYAYCRCNCGHGEDGSWAISYNNLCNKHKWCPSCCGNSAKGDGWIDLLNQINANWIFSKLNFDDELLNYSKVNAYCKLHDHDWTPRIADIQDGKGCEYCKNCVKRPLEEQINIASKIAENQTTYRLGKQHSESLGVFTRFSIVCATHGLSSNWMHPFYIPLQKIVYGKPQQCPLCQKDYRNFTYVLNSLSGYDINSGYKSDLYLKLFYSDIIEAEIFKPGISVNHNERYTETPLKKDKLSFIETIDVEEAIPAPIVVLAEKWILDNHLTGKFEAEEIDIAMVNVSGSSEAYKTNPIQKSLSDEISKMLSDKKWWVNLTNNEEARIAATDIWTSFCDLRRRTASLS
ncbi:hypothetical protein [Thalassotalea litorea]|uniref:hypothetical protein n=1 Tax=Thalassotalea litorea TaxID=2020715 RepID=UPI0037367179